MRYIRVIILLAFLVAAGGYGTLYYQHTMTADTQAPVIKADSNYIIVNAKDGTSELLKGLSAYDNVDGDISDEIIIENMSFFDADHTREVNYVVCDTSNNTTRYTRTVSYYDYIPPRFSLEKPLRFRENDKINIADYLKAEDVLDGDISKTIQMVGQDYYSRNHGIEVGQNIYKFHVSNSAGDTSYVEVLVDTEEDEAITCVPYVNLSQYIVYVRKGTIFNPYQYIDNVTISNRVFDIISTADEESAREGKIVKGLFGDLSKRDADDDLITEIAYSDIYVDNPVDLSTPGNYVVRYQITTQDRITGTTGLSVVVIE